MTVGSATLFLRVSRLVVSDCDVFPFASSNMMPVACWSNWMARRQGRARAHLWRRTQLGAAGRVTGKQQGASAGVAGPAGCGGTCDRQ